MKKILTLIACFLITISLFAKPPINDDLSGGSNETYIIDLQTFINANKLLMFVTNRGSIGYDQGGFFGKNDGLYYPYSNLNDITSGLNTNTVLFAGGIWIGAIDNSTGDTLVSVSEYSDEYWPGPMIGGTFDPNGAADPSYRVYKIYKDSMSGNPNNDYLNWPVSDGAPVDNYGAPLLIGDQSLWTVYNDANPAVHNNNASGNIGLGVEIQQFTWARKQPGNIEIPTESVIEVQQLGNSKATVGVYVSDYLLLTGDDYIVVLDSHLTLGPVWHLDNISSNIRVLENQTDSARADGFLVIVKFNLSQSQFSSFQVVSNGNGVIDPPVSGAFAFRGFPTPNDENPTDEQQVGNGHWAIHTGDNGGTSGGGTRGTFDAFLSRVLRGDNAEDLGEFDYEMRFTGSYSNPEVGGSYAIKAFQNDDVIWVPFELWRTGVNTPNDFSDDVRMVVWILDFGEDRTFNLEHWGTSAFGGANYEHSASGGDNDPYTDWVYWLLPTDDSPGESGYQAKVDKMLSGNYLFDDEEVMARIVLINSNGGNSPPFSQSLPEQGTIFRMETTEQLPIDTFSFTAGAVTPPIFAGPDDLSIYTRYKLINKGGKNLKDFYISLWFDPDLGSAVDDFVGCDTLNNLFFCYNDGPDIDYGFSAPSFGGKLLEGPIVPSPGDVAIVDGIEIPNYRNLNMTSFQKYINGTDPGHYRESYNYMRGLNRNGTPLANGSKFALPGDPVAGIGEIDINSSDRRMMASFGPFDFAPGDTQQVFFKLSVGQGNSPLNSITILKEILNIQYENPPTEAKVFITPDTLFAAYLHYLETKYGTIKIGNLQDGLPVTEINSSTVRINGSIVPTAIEILPSYQGFVGQVMELTFEVSDLINMHMPLWDLTVEPFIVSGSYNNSDPFAVNGLVIFRGHSTGDVNLDGIVNLLDLTYLINHLFKEGPDLRMPILGDVNGSCGSPNVGDIAYFISYLFKNGASLKKGCQ